MAALVLAACAPCPSPTYLETLVFQSQAGEPLAPLRVDELETGETYVCTPGSGTRVDCQNNRMMIRRFTTASHEVRAQSVTGLVFEGRVTPEIIVPEEKDECWVPTLGDVVLVLN